MFYTLLFFNTDFFFTENTIEAGLGGGGANVWLAPVSANKNFLATSKIFYLTEEKHRRNLYNFSKHTLVFHLRNYSADLNIITLCPAVLQLTFSSVKLCLALTL